MRRDRHSLAVVADASMAELRLCSFLILWLTFFFFLGVAREWFFHSINNLPPFQACGLTDSPGSFLSPTCTRIFWKMTVLIFTWWIILVPEVLIPGLKISTLWFVTSWLRIYLTMKGRVQFFLGFCNILLSFGCDNLQRDYNWQSYYSYNTTGTAMEQLFS